MKTFLLRKIEAATLPASSAATAFAGAAVWIFLLLTGVIGLAIPGRANAAITCTIAAPTALNFVYVSGTNNTSPNNKLQSAIVATCQRTLVGDPTTAVVTLGANNGQQPAAPNNRALFSGNLIQYALWRDVACSAAFLDTAPTRISANFASTTLSPVSLTFNYWACIPGQVVSSFPAGVYTDSVSLFLRNGAVQLATAAIPVNITAPASCSISGGPGNLTFSYTAFGSANFQSTGFTANCTNSLPYTMDVSPVAGVVGGLRYVLGLADVAGSASNLGPATLGRVGSATGSRSHVINGAMVANQAGLQGAIVPQPHTLTITY